MSFSCIIPAYNEGPRIANVISAVLCCDHIDEVIVVDDCSMDNTREMIDAFTHPKLRTIFLEKNAGKTNAVLTGIRIAKGEYIVMIDSDLLYLYPSHITALIDPIRNMQSDISLSIRENSLPIYKFLGTDFVSGERVLPRTIFDDEQYYLRGSRFGLEVLLNARSIELGYSVSNIYLKDVITPRKSEKIGYIRGTLADLRMIRDILSVMPLHRLIYQLWYFSRFYPK